MKSLQEKIKNLPGLPGVYIFRDENGEILYIGKATNLRERVRSYFKNNLENRPVIFAINQIADIETQKTDSVLEALILEANLIKKFQPKYNVEGKDDKSFSYTVITKEEFPRVLILRESELAATSPQPSPSKGEGEDGNATHMSGSKKKSDVLSFKFQISRIFGPYTSKKNLETALKIMRKIFPFHSGKQKTEKGCLDFQIGLCPGPYANAISKEDYRKNIRGIRMILEGKKQNLIKKLEKEMQEYSRKQEFEKAGEMRNKIFALKHIQDVALISSGDENFQIPNPKSQTNYKFQIQNSKFRTEAYDISNISGQYATGSMIVFENNEPNKNEYRKFRIKTVAGSNDVGMMKEILLRRFQNNWPKPDLILLDGGAGHLNMGEAVLKSLNLDIPVAAIAKGKSRKNQEVSSKQKIENILDKKTIKRIMDEAHRFAIGYHRKLRKASIYNKGK